MHSPGVCGAILAFGPFAGAVALPQSQPPDVAPLIDALNADTEMVLVGAAESADALAPAVWARAAYLVRLPLGATEVDGLRALLQETLSRGRDAILVTTLAGPLLTAEIVRQMVAAYRAAGHEVWAIVLDNVRDPSAEAAPREAATGYPVLLGRRMIEVFLRGREWCSAQEVLAANREHVHALNLSERVPNEPSVGSQG